MPIVTRIYIDGYNLYYGCLKGTTYKWLDLLKLFEESILPSVRSLNASGSPRKAVLAQAPAIKFFTAKIVESVAKSPDSVSCQARYHTALRKLYGNKLEIVEGYYAINPMRVKVIDEVHPEKAPSKCDEVQAWKVEEKQSDVHLALQAYHDAMTSQVDQVIFVTNDTDIAPALKMIREHTTTQVGVVIPTTNHQRKANSALSELAHWTRSHITEEELSKSQLPRVIAGRKPTLKPISWYPHPELLKEILELAKPIRRSQSEVFKWMNQENEYLNGERPIDMIETEKGSLEVLEYIKAWIDQSK